MRHPRFKSDIKLVVRPLNNGSLQVFLHKNVKDGTLVPDGKPTIEQAVFLRSSQENGNYVINLSIEECWFDEYEYLGSDVKLVDGYVANWDI